MAFLLDPERVLDHPLALPPAREGIELGRSREGRAITGYRAGRGPRRVSLVGGLHADEPVGPAMLARLAAWLLGSAEAGSALAAFSFWIVPHGNPDGAERNRVWTEPMGPAGSWARREPPVVADLAAYQELAVREGPGDDLEFGFPRGEGDAEARPEAWAIAAFLAGGAPFSLHGSFHGMSYATGPWLLLERAWIDRTLALRDRMRAEVAARGYRPHEVDRRGEKGFDRIDPGFTTRPDAEAMRRHFLARGEAATATLFRPSSMEHVRSLGGDPLTIVSEMPLFLREEPGAPVRPMPLRDQMALQIAYLDAALEAVTRVDAG